MEEVYASPTHHMHKDAKIEWLTLELSGGAANLRTFALKFKEIFSDVLGIKEQRRLCLELYRDYARVKEATIAGEYESVEEYRTKAYTCGVNIPACEIQGFLKVWDENAPARCHGCKAELPKECANIRCTTCIAATKKKYKTTCKQCDGEVVAINECFVCTDCGHGATYASNLPTDATELNDALCLLNNFLDFNNEEIEEHGAIKRQRL